MSTNSKLRKLASILPPLPKYKIGKGGEKVMQTTIPTRVVTGKQWLKENPDAKRDDGKPIVDNENYKLSYAPETINVDHFDELKATHTKFGADGVNEYIRICFDFNKEVRPDDLIFT